MLRKIGKADLLRKTLSSGLPTRIHQQVRKLIKIYGKSNVRPRVVQQLENATTKQAKLAEQAALQKYFDQTGMIPFRNRKSFIPTMPTPGG